MPSFSKIKQTLRNYRVGIAGAGGLGSNVAMMLTRAGIGTLVISDYDCVEESNLNRQFYFRKQLGQLKVNALADNLKEIDPSITLEIHPIRLTQSNIPEIYRKVDVMVEAFDNSAMKKTIIEVFQEKFPDTPLIVGNGMAGWGKTDAMTLTRLDNLYICGDGCSEVSPDLPPIAPRVTLCAAMQANITLSLLLDPVLGNTFNP